MTCKIDVDPFVKDLETIKDKARMSPHLQDAVDGLITALKDCNLGLATALSSVKSFVTDMKYKGPRDHFNEDSKYNMNVLPGGSSVAGTLDGMHLILAMRTGEMPRGETRITSRGIEQRGLETIKHPILDLMNVEKSLIKLEVRDKPCSDLPAKSLKILCKANGVEGYATMDAGEMGRKCC